MIDKDAFDTFYMGLIAAGLDKDAIAIAVGPLSKVGQAIGADFVTQITGEAIIAAPEGIQINPMSNLIGDEGREYVYSVNQTIDDVKVVLKLALLFEDTGPTIATLTGGVKGYNVGLHGLKVVVNEMSMTTNRATVTLDTTTSVVASFPRLSARVVLAADGKTLLGATIISKNRTNVTGPTAILDLKVKAVTGKVGVTANAGGTIGELNAELLDLTAGASDITVTTPNVTVKMQGIQM
ncbi:MAG: hypothetical protein U5M23_01595 [Marinagarivorans sp.]|nr:hypothetical protein [Marinagarivorans sp.]